MKRCLIGASTVFATATLLLAATVILYDELGAFTEDNDVIASDGPLYASFSTGSTPVSLTDVMARLTGRNFAVTSTPHARHSGAPQRSVSRGTASISPVTTVGLYSDSSIHPGVLLKTLGTVADTALPLSGYSNFDFPVNPPFALNASTRYWIGFSATSGSSAGLAWTVDTTGTGAATEFNVFRGTVFSNSEGPYQLRITAQTSGTTPSPTPVPPSIVLGLTGLAIAFLFSTRRWFPRKA